MANKHVPDQSKEFKESGMKLISDPASDALLEKARQAAKNASKVNKR